MRHDEVGRRRAIEGNCRGSFLLRPATAQRGARGRSLVPLKIHSRGFGVRQTIPPRTMPFPYHPPNSIEHRGFCPPENYMKVGIDRSILRCIPERYGVSIRSDRLPGTSATWCGCAYFLIQRPRLPDRQRHDPRVPRYPAAGADRRPGGITGVRSAFAGPWRRVPAPRRRRRTRLGTGSGRSLPGGGRPCAGHGRT